MENILEGVQIITIEMFLLTYTKKKQTVPLPAIIGKDGDVFVAWCPIVNVATQGDTIDEAIENMAEMLVDYYNDPDTQKPEFVVEQEFFSVRKVSTPEEIEEGIDHDKITPFAVQKSR